jgi:hypothetical protein
MFSHIDNELWRFQMFSTSTKAKKCLVRFSFLSMCSFETEQKTEIEWVKTLRNPFLSFFLSAEKQTCLLKRVLFVDQNVHLVHIVIVVNNTYVVITRKNMMIYLMHNLNHH